MIEDWAFKAAIGLMIGVLFGLVIIISTIAIISILPIICFIYSFKIKHFWLSLSCSISSFIFLTL